MTTGSLHFRLRRLLLAPLVVEVEVVVEQVLVLGQLVAKRALERALVLPVDVVHVTLSVGGVGELLAALKADHPGRARAPPPRPQPLPQPLPPCLRSQNTTRCHHQHRKQHMRYKQASQRRQHRGSRASKWRTATQKFRGKK